MFVDTLHTDFPELNWENHAMNNPFMPWWKESWLGSVYDNEIFFIYYTIDGSYKMAIMGKFLESIKNTKFFKDNEFLFTSSEIDYHTNRGYIKKILPTMLNLAKNNYIKHKKEIIDEVCKYKY